MHRAQISLHCKCKLTVKGCATSGSQPNTRDLHSQSRSLCLVSVTCLSGLSFCTSFYTTLAYVETVHADGCVHGTEVLCTGILLSAGLQTEAPWIPGNGLVRGQGCSPYCSGKPALFLLRGSVRSHSANPGREGEMRGDGCLVTLAVTSAHLVWQTGYIYTDFSYTLTKARKTHLAQ